MAFIFVRSTDGNDGNSGAYGSPKATLAGALAIATTSDIIAVSKIHAEATTGNVTLTSPGTANIPILILCVDDWVASPTTLATSATISATGNIVLGTGYAVVLGVTLIPGSAGGNGLLTAFAGTCGWIFDASGISLASAGSGAYIQFGSSSTDVFVELNNCTLTFGNAGHNLYIGCDLKWFGGSIAGTAPTNLFEAANSLGPASVELHGVDLSLMGSGKNLLSAASTQLLSVRLMECKIDSAVTRVTGTRTGRPGATLELVSTAGSAINYNSERYRYEGAITTETTIVKTGGFSNGTTPTSRKFVSSAYATKGFPLQTPWTEWIINETGSPITVEASVVTDGVTLTDAEMWIEVEYFGSSSYPVTSLTSDVSAYLGTPANQDSDTAAWTTTGLSSPVKQKLSVSVTPQMAGPMRARLCLAKASTTVYADLKFLTDSSRQWVSENGYINEGVSSGGVYRRRAMAGGLDRRGIS